jgi:class 3 adenylate cyclase/tetratricopeptide (TPR) repeat protein
MYFFSKLVNTFTIQQMGVVEETKADLTPYVPRLVVEWLRRDPDSRWREVDGTLAFVDISGFTAMSERLAKRGKAGAEQVTEVMNATFGRLLEVAYAYGGGLLKFGGDALLLLFDGDGHAPRAARAAYGMRRALAQIERAPTSVGAVTLRMHVGLHSDRFQFFLVGDTHRELVVTGPGATRTVEMEGTAEAGEILLSAAAAAKLESGYVGAAKGSGFLLAAEPSAAARLESLPDVAGLELERCVPVAVREELLTGAVEPEHRQAAVAFLRFHGTDELIAASGAEAAADALEELVRAVQAATDEHSVCFLESDIDKDGGRIVLVAGAPQTSEEDEERILRTVRAVVESGGRLRVAVGVNRGRVFAGEVGAAFRKTYTILGDTAALAARLMARADPGQILAPPEVVERSPTRFAVRKVEPFAVKGRSTPVAALEVGPVEGVRPVQEARRLPLVGRERELAVLAAALAPVRAGFGTLVELIGEAGIGKSRVVEELRAAAGMTAVTTACDRYEASTPYFSFRGLLRDLLAVSFEDNPARNSERLRERLGASTPDLVPWIPLIALALDVSVAPTREVDELQPAFRRARLKGVIETLLRTLLPNPTLLVFEDVHWMDEASSDLLRHLGERVGQSPWLLCTTRRPTGGGFLAAQGIPPVPAMTIRLEPLTPEAARALVEAAAGVPLLDRDVVAITERAGGNPLFLEELVAATPAEAEQVEVLPESVEAVVTTRIDQLAPRDRVLLRWASVLGTSFSGEVVAEALDGDPSAAPDSESWDRLADFLERDPYVPGGFRFRHALIRDAAYEGLSFRRRRELHARAGETYERLNAGRLDDVAELLSLHFFWAEIYDKAWKYSLRAGERAQEKFANVEAAEFYRRAIESARHVPELGAEPVALAWESLGDVSALAGLYDDAASAYKRARRLVKEDTLSEVALFHKEARLRENMGKYSEALRWLGRGLKTVEKLPNERQRVASRIELTLDYAGVRYRQGDFTGAIEWGRRGVDDAQPALELRGLARGYYLLHLAYTSLGSPERLAFRGLAIPIYEELGDLAGQASALNNLGIDAYFEGRWDEALDAYRRSKEFMERIGDVVGAAMLGNNIGEIKSDQGHFDVARSQFEESRSVTAAAGHKLLATVARSNLARLAAREGRWQEAVAELEEALAGFREIKAASFVVETQARIAEAHLLAGREPEGVYDLASKALGGARDAGGMAAVEAMLHRLRGYALLQAGDAAAAREPFEESLRTAREAAAEYEVALTLEALGEHDEAQKIFERLGVVSVPRIPLP